MHTLGLAGQPVHVLKQTQCVKGFVDAQMTVPEDIPAVFAPLEVWLVYWKPVSVCK